MVVLSQRQQRAEKALRRLARAAFACELACASSYIMRGAEAVEVQQQRQLQLAARARPHSARSFTTKRTRCRQLSSVHRAQLLYGHNGARWLLITRETFGNHCCAPSSIAAFQPQDPPVEQVQQQQTSLTRPKFQPFIPQTGVRKELLDYRHQVQFPTHWSRFVVSMDKARVFKAGQGCWRCTAHPSAHTDQGS